MSATERHRPAVPGVAVLIAQVIAVSVLLVAWNGASREVRVADQWGWGAVSVAALVLSAITNAAVIVALRRRVARVAREL